MNCVYLYNPNSGKSKYKNKQKYLIKRLHEKFDIVDYFETKSKEDVNRLAKEACGYYDAIIFSGGDGTVNDIVNAVMGEEKQPVLGYLPSGTCNDFARSLSIPKKLDEALDVIVNGCAKNFDIFKANDKYGVYVCAYGLFTSASYDTEQSKKRKLGKIAYYFHSFKEIFSCKASDFNVKLYKGESGGELQEFCGKSVLTLLINSKSVAGYKLNNGVDLHDGEMEFLAVLSKKQRLTFKSLMIICATFLFGINWAKKQKCVMYGKFKKCELEFTSNNPVLNIDGENGGVNNCKLVVLKDCLKVFSAKD